MLRVDRYSSTRRQGVYVDGRPFALQQPKEQFQSKIDEAWNQFPGGYDGSCKEMASIKGLHMTVESGLGQLTLRDAPTWLVKKMSDYLVPSIFEISQRQCASNLETDPIFEVRT